MHPIRKPKAKESPNKKDPSPHPLKRSKTMPMLPPSASAPAKPQQQPHPATLLPLPPSPTKRKKVSAAPRWRQKALQRVKSFVVKERREQRKQRRDTAAQGKRESKKDGVLKKKRSESLPPFDLSNAEIVAVDSNEHDFGGAAGGISASGDYDDLDNFIKQIEDEMKQDAEKIFKTGKKSK